MTKDRNEAHEVDQSGPVDVEWAIIRLPIALILYAPIFYWQALMWMLVGGFALSTWFFWAPLAAMYNLMVGSEKAPLFLLDAAWSARKRNWRKTTASFKAYLASGTYP